MTTLINQLNAIDIRKDTELICDKISNLVLEFNGNESALERISDRIVDLMYNSFSNISRDLAKIGFILKSNYHVDNMIKIINDKNSSYVAWYASRTLCHIATEYAVEQAVKNKITDAYIMPLYQRYIDRGDVIMLLINIVEENKYIGAGYVRPKKLLNKQIKKNINDPIVQAYLILCFNKKLNSDNYIAHACKPYLKLLRPVKNNPKVRAVFDTATRSNITELENNAKILDLNIDIKEVKRTLLDNILLMCVVEKKFDVIAYIFHKYYDPVNKRLRNKKMMYIAEFMSFHRYVIEDSFLKKRQKEESDKQDECYGLTPLGGFSDHNFQNYYYELICLGLIAQFTDDADIYKDIENFFMKNLQRKNKGLHFKGDEYTLKECKKFLNKNVFFGTKTKLSDETSYSNIYSRFGLHRNDNIYQDYINIRIGCLLNLVSVSKGDESLYYKLVISNYYNTEYRWMWQTYTNKYHDDMQLISCVDSSR